MKKAAHESRLFRGRKKDELGMFSVIVRVWVYEFAPIDISPVKSGDNNLCRAYIRGNGNVVEVTCADKGIIVKSMFDIFGLAVAEIDENVYFVEGDAARELLHTALTAGKELFNMKSRCVINHRAR